MTGVFDSEHHSINDSETLLRRVIDIIATARTIPLSSSPMINRDEILEMLEEALNRLPEELRQARRMLKERDEFVIKTRREADDILDASRAQAERMVQRTEVVKSAEHRARHIIDMAEATGPAAFIRQETALLEREDYTPLLPEIRCPTLVIVGEADAITPVLMVQAMAQQIPGARLEVIAGCGHLSTLECPAETTVLLKAWLS